MVRRASRGPYEFCPATPALKALGAQRGRSLACAFFLAGAVLYVKSTHSGTLCPLQTLFINL
jgi:hypothetical protein